MKLTVGNIHKTLNEAGYHARLAGKTFIADVGTQMDDLDAETRGQRMCKAFEEAWAWHNLLLADPKGREALPADIDDISVALGHGAANFCREKKWIA